MKRKGILFVVIGPSGSGKSTICSKLVSEFSPSLHYSVSVTSRSPRRNEVQGKSYHFVTREEFAAKRERGEFFEWEETHGNLYGTLRSSLENGISEGQDLLFQIDIRGALTMKASFPDNAVTIFLLPPSFDALRERIVGRGTMDSQEMERRFATARKEYEVLQSLRLEQGKIDYLLVNKDLEETYARVRSIVVAERTRYIRLHGPDVAAFCSVSEEGSS